MEHYHTAPNFYQRWAYVDEICQALDQDLNLLSHDYQLSKNIIKIVRILGYLDHFSTSVWDSFNHPTQPKQVDTYKKIDWMRSFREILHDWHHVFHLYLIQNNPSKIVNLKIPKFYCQTILEEKIALNKQQQFWNKQHASMVFSTSNSTYNWKSLQNKLVDKQLILTITNDQELDPAKKKYAHIEPFFRGIHQMIEVAMNVIIDIVEQLSHEISHLIVINEKVKLDKKNNLNKIRLTLSFIQQWWEVAAKHIMLLSKMDTGSYAEYRQSLLGTSGGDSKQLRHLKNLMTCLHLRLPEILQEKSALMLALNKNSHDPSLNQLLSSIRETQAAASDFWLRHFTLTANTIGMIKGSQGLPVEKLISFAISPLSKQNSLLQVVGEVGSYYAQSPDASLVKINNEEKIIGNTILAHVKDRVTILSPYQLPPSEQTSILDNFDLRPVEPNDAHESPYASWFDVNLHINGIFFGMHSFGTPLVFFNESSAKTVHRLIEQQNNYWETFFSSRINQFQDILFNVLEIPNDDSFFVSVDANATAILERLLSAVSINNKNVILTTNQEFLAANRTLASFAKQNQLKIAHAMIDENDLDLSQAFKKHINDKLAFVMFSQVMSNTQVSMTDIEIIQILDNIPHDVPVIIDAVQSVCNVSIAWGKILKNRKNVYVIGSGIKHARSTSGLGFLIYPSNDGILYHPKLSGWCAYLSGMSSGKTTDDHQCLLYDDRWQWFGGTPANVFALELFINTWDAITRNKQTISSMYQYVQSLHQYFFSLLKSKNINAVDHVRRKHFPNFSSNAVVLKSSELNTSSLLAIADKKRIYFDQREGNIRLGFGIQHSRNDIDKLADIFFC
ncbi:MAG: hypothetical protein ACD_46C00291G0006 [uncultured bacterium]|nr:MAG: hypothetical protein ACD_46C00291G0006 [uncultured bacterium]